jgi:PTS system cellobiose-specific IIC component
MIGGVGATLAVISAILIFSKAKAQKQVSKVAAGSAIFQINEPVLFGLPMILNPIYFIPFAFVPPILGMITYGFHSSG